MGDNIDLAWTTLKGTGTATYRKDDLCLQQKVHSMHTSLSATVLNPGYGQKKCEITWKQASNAGIMLENRRQPENLEQKENKVI